LTDGSGHHTTFLGRRSSGRLFTALPRPGVALFLPSAHIIISAT